MSEQTEFYPMPSFPTLAARDFSIADADGYALIFTMGPLRRELPFEAVIANARHAQ